MEGLNAQAVSGGVVGIDAGVEGYATRVVDGRPVQFWPAPTYGGVGGKQYDNALALRQAFEWKGLGVRKVLLERLTNLPPRMGGGRTNYKRGEAMGVWRTALAAADIGFEEVEPGDWKVALGITGEEEVRKTRAIAKAKSLSPSTDFRDHERRPGAMTPSSDKCESFLLGWYCERLEKGDVAEFEAAKRAWKEQDGERRREREKQRRSKKTKSKKTKSKKKSKKSKRRRQRGKPNGRPNDNGGA